MKRAYAGSQYAKPCERYCRETYPGEADEIFQKAEAYYLAFMQDMPDLGENMMAKNMLDGLVQAVPRRREAAHHKAEHQQDGAPAPPVKDIRAVKNRISDEPQQGEYHHRCGGGDDISEIKLHKILLFSL